MTCRRCDGFMVQEDYFALQESQRHFTIWRCVLCGDLVDQTIAANRHRQRTGVQGTIAGAARRTAVRSIGRLREPWKAFLKEGAET